MKNFLLIKQKENIKKVKKKFLIIFIKSNNIFTIA